VNITGSATLHAPPPQAWAALNDPAALTRTIPGCEHLEATGPASYRLTITAGVASIQGTYTTGISLTDRQEPTSCRLALHAAGAPGTLTATVLVLLVPSGNGTEVTYAADATPDGMIAAVGQRLLASTAQKLASDFFASIDELLVSAATAVSSTSGVGEPQPPQGVRAGGAAGVSSLAAVPTRGASGMTREPSTAGRQPAGRPSARPHTGSFWQGALAGAAATLAGLGVARLLGRRSR
jgi:carbon monoxide dehydrogenase subunit G